MPGHKKVRITNENLKNRQIALFVTHQFRIAIWAIVLNSCKDLFIQSRKTCVQRDFVSVEQTAAEMLFFSRSFSSYEQHREF